MKRGASPGDPGGVRIREFSADEAVETETVIELWERCGLTRPWNDPRLDIARKLAVQPELFLVAVTYGEPGEPAVLVGTVMAGYDGHRGWMYYLASDPAHRGVGIGRALVAEAERRLEAMGCPKAQLMVRSENEAAVGFYEALGYEPGEVLVLGRRLVSDAG